MTQPNQLNLMCLDIKMEFMVQLATGGKIKYVSTMEIQNIALTNNSSLMPSTKINIHLSLELLDLDLAPQDMEILSWLTLDQTQIMQ